MPIDIDGPAVLRAISENPTAFPDLAADLNAVARKLVVKQLKAKGTTLELVRRIYSAIGSGAFPLILDDLGNSGGASFAKKLDKDNSNLPTAEPECRKHIVLLASGAVPPAVKPLKPMPKTKSPTAARPAKVPKPPLLSQEEQELANVLKAKTTNLATARDLWRKASDANLKLVLANLPAQSIRSIAKKLDGANPNNGASSPATLRELIVDLVSGRAEPVFRDIMQSESMATVGQRKMK
jgi:hypothetical protein